MGVQVQTVEFRGWKGLRNGKLVSVAAESGINCILTKDRLFVQDAKKALLKYPQVALVLVLIAQLPRKKYAETFESHWKKESIQPVAGQVIEWPNDG